MSSNSSLPEHLVDLSKLETATGGNSDFMKKMIELFLEDTPPQIDKMREALDSNDIETLSAIAHKIKPSLDMMACPELGVLVRDVEKATDAAILPDANLLITCLSRLIDQIKAR